MKLQQLFEAENELGFDEKYTRDENPEVYDDNIIVMARKLSSFDAFPKKLGPRVDGFDIGDNEFKDFKGFPNFASDYSKSGLYLYAARNPLTSLEGLPDKIGTLNLYGCHLLTSLENCPMIYEQLDISGCKSIENFKRDQNNQHNKFKHLSG
jgi:hypothetical protein